MPFTLAHPALVVPLARRGLPLSALVIGAISPDIAYLYPWRVSWLSQAKDLGRLSHSWLGLLWFCLPIGLMIWVVFHAVVKVPSLTLVPRKWRARLARLAFEFTWPRGTGWGAVLLALGLGAASHLAWDLVTHDGAYEIARTLGWSRGRVLVFALLQGGSTLVGLGYLALACFRWQSQALESSGPSVPDGPSWLKHVAFWGILCVTAGLYVSSVTERPMHLWSPSFLYSAVRHTLIWGGAIVAVMIFLYSCFWHLQRSRDI
jgi:hypothetical protein